MIFKNVDEPSPQNTSDSYLTSMRILSHDGLWDLYPGTDVFVDDQWMGNTANSMGLVSTNISFWLKPNVSETIYVANPTFPTREIKATVYYNDTYLPPVYMLANTQNVQKTTTSLGQELFVTNGDHSADIFGYSLENSWRGYPIEGQCVFKVSDYGNKDHLFSLP